MLTFDWHALYASQRLALIKYNKSKLSPMIESYRHEYYQYYSL